MAESTTENQRVADILLKIERGIVSAQEETELKSILKKQVVQGEAEYDKVKEGSSKKAKELFESVGEDFSKRAGQLDSGLFLSAAPSIVFDTRDEEGQQ